MPTLDMVDVAIGLALVYALMSLVLTAFREAIETFVKSRSRQLEKGIGELFGGDPALISQEAGAGVPRGLPAQSPRVIWP